MRRARIAAAVATVVLAAFSRLSASISVEQIEAFETDTGDNSSAPTRYAPIDFSGASQVKPTSGQYAGITFHALGGTTTTNSDHAGVVANIIFGKDSVSYPYISDVYNIPATTFFTSVIQTTDALSATGPLPGHFATGVKVVDNGYAGASPSNLDVIRRLDYMINQDDVTFVAAASNTANAPTGLLAWSSYNALAVSGQGTFTPIYSPEKKHADLSGPGLTSFTEAAVASNSATLFGQAQIVNQTDAMHSVVNRSLLMAGTDKTSYSRDTTNNLSLQYGAGQVNLDTSLAILGTGEKPLAAVTGLSTVAGVPSWSSKGWSYGIVPANGQSAVLFHSDGGLTGLSASLNWNADQPTNAANPNQLDTTASSILANLSLDVRPITYANGSAVIGASQTDITLHSTAANDNVEYLYFTGTLPAGDYAFVIDGDTNLSTPVGFSYSLTETPTTAFQNHAGGSWGNAGNWPGSIPNSPGAQASFISSTTGNDSATTITLDGDRTVGSLTFDDLAGYTIGGTTGTLILNNNGSPATVTTVSGNHTISAPISAVNGITFTTAAGASLNLTGTVAVSGPIVLNGSGIFDVTGTFASASTIVVNGTLNFIAHPVAHVTARTLTSLTINGTGVATLVNSTTQGDRTILLTNSLSVTGMLDLQTNDLVVHNGNLHNIVNEVIAGESGAGIQSSTALADSNGIATLAAISNDNGSGSVNLSDLDGQPLVSSDIIVMSTYFGDANLNGHLDAADLVKINNGFANHLTGWQNGDFNYDGTIDGSDYSLLDYANLATGGTAVPAASIADSSSQVASVPEPSTFLLIAGLVGFSSRKRRR